MKRNKANTCLRAGFTLVEMTVASSIMVIISFAVFGIQYIISQNQNVVIDGSLKTEAANGILATAIKEIRNAKSGQNGEFTIEYGDSQNIIFYSDIDKDGITEKIRYFANSNEFKKGVIKATGNPYTYLAENEKVYTLTSDLRNGNLPIFYYFNSSYPTNLQNNPMQNPVDNDQVRLIKIYLRINQKENDSESDYIVESFVQIRSLKDN